VLAEVVLVAAAVVNEIECRLFWQVSCFPILSGCFKLFVYKYIKYLELAVFIFNKQEHVFLFIFVNSDLAGKACAEFILKGMCLWFI
jgi:hypothetical protein